MKTRRTQKQIAKANRRKQSVENFEQRIGKCIDFASKHCLTAETALLICASSLSLKACEKQLSTIDTTNRFSHSMLLEPLPLKHQKHPVILKSEKRPFDFSRCGNLQAQTENLTIKNNILEHYIGLFLGTDTVWMECPEYLQSYLGTV